MNNKQLLGIFVVAAAAAITGAVYFGGMDQQASVANIVRSPMIITPEPTVVGEMDDVAWKSLCDDGKPHIQLISPNGGETYTVGRSLPVTWRSCNAPAGYVRGSVSDASGKDYLVEFGNWIGDRAYQTQNDGVESTIISGDVLPGQDYMLHLQVFSNSGVPSVMDTSNTSFTFTQ